MELWILSQLSLITCQDSHWWAGLYSVELLVDVALWRSPNNKTLMLGQRIAHLKLTTGTHCPGQHPHSSLNIQKSGDICMKPFLHVLVALVQEGSIWLQKQLCGHKPRHKTFGLQSILLERCAEAIELGELSTNGWFNLRPSPGVGASTSSCLDGSELETRYPRDIGYIGNNQTQLALIKQNK